jgi:recombination protein RecR
MSFSGRAFQNLVEEFGRLPGIGNKTAERLAHYVLQAPAEEVLKLAEAIREVKETIGHCRLCFNLAEKELCSICEDPSRDPRLLCIVEHPRDLHAIEQSGSYRGRYHVLQGVFAPLEGVSPEDLTLAPLLERLEKEPVEEVILATNPSFEGEGTALYLKERLAQLPRKLRVTRIARGMPSGSLFEHVSRAIVADALEGRREME